MSEGGGEEATIWEHLEELSIRLRRIIIAVAIAAVIAAAVPLEAIQGIASSIHIQLPFIQPEHHPASNATKPNETILGRLNLLECSVVKVAEGNSSSLLVTLECRALHNSTGNSGSGSDVLGGLIPVGRVHWTPLVVKLPEMLVALIVPKYVYAMGKKYPVYIMSADTFEAFQIILYSALLLGVILASPIIVREVWAYVEPALYPHEKRLVKRYSVAFLLLFLGGVALALFIIAPLAYHVTLMLYPYFAPQGYQVIIRVSIAEVLQFAVQLALVTGLIFETPVIIYILVTHGVIEPETVERNLKYIFLAAMVAGAILSPDPSGLGMIIIGLTLYAPIHIATWLAARKVRKMRREKSEEEG